MNDDFVSYLNTLEGAPAAGTLAHTTLITAGQLWQSGDHDSAMNIISFAPVDDAIKQSVKNFLQTVQQPTQTIAPAAPETVAPAAVPEIQTVVMPEQMKPTAEPVNATTTAEIPTVAEFVVPQTPVAENENKFSFSSIHVGDPYVPTTTEPVNNIPVADIPQTTVSSIAETVVNKNIDHASNFLPEVAPLELVASDSIAPAQMPAAFAPVPPAPTIPTPTTESIAQSFEPEPTITTPPATSGANNDLMSYLLQKRGEQNSVTTNSDTAPTLPIENDADKIPTTPTQKNESPIIENNSSAVNIPTAPTTRTLQPSAQAILETMNSGAAPQQTLHDIINSVATPTSGDMSRSDMLAKMFDDAANKKPVAVVMDPVPGIIHTYDTTAEDLAHKKTHDAVEQHEADKVKKFFEKVEEYLKKAYQSGNKNLILSAERQLDNLVTRYPEYADVYHDHVQQLQMMRTQFSAKTLPEYMIAGVTIKPGMTISGSIKYKLSEIQDQNGNIVFVFTSEKGNYDIPESELAAALDQDALAADEFFKRFG